MVDVQRFLLYPFTFSLYFPKFFVLILPLSFSFSLSDIPFFLLSIYQSPIFPSHSLPPPLCLSLCLCLSFSQNRVSCPCIQFISFSLSLRLHGCIPLSLSLSLSTSLSFFLSLSPVQSFFPNIFFFSFKRLPLPCHSFWMKTRNLLHQPKRPMYLQPVKSPSQ